MRLFHSKDKVPGKYINSFQQNTKRSFLDYFRAKKTVQDDEGVRDRKLKHEDVF